MLRLYAEVRELYKNEADQYIVKLIIGNGQTTKVIPIDEFVSLSIGDTILVDVQWNENGVGQESTVIRPLVIHHRENKCVCAYTTTQRSVS